MLVSSVAVGSYVLNLGLESAVFLISAVFILLIPELGPKGAIAKKIAQDEAAAAPNASVE